VLASPSLIQVSLDLCLLGFASEVKWRPEADLTSL